MLQILDKNGKATLIWRDEDDAPVSVDEMILREKRLTTKQDEKETENADKQRNAV